MSKHFNSRILILIPIVFLIVIVFKLFYAYNDVEERKYNFAKKEAEVLNSFTMSHRNYCQNFFVNKIIELTPKTLPVLPAFSSLPISEAFSQNNPLSISVRTVSDRARNHKNMADKDEMKAIEFLKVNRDKKIYFSDENSEFYQYAYALRIEKKCLTCHGAKKNAPNFIQEKYSNAYDYKLGEIRGIHSIKVPTENLDRYFLTNFFYSIIYDTLLLIALFLVIFYLIKKSKSINDFLGTEVERKTKEVKDLLVFDRLTKLPNRLKLIEDIEEHLNVKNRHLALINIDSFKDIN
ncbi:MAG: DUF3365 domain-containing protein, partial [Sulfurimonas sp.]|nr:DUF3365 domain-containing protein [Sulfurimonas sp.]